MPIAARDLARPLFLSLALAWTSVLHARLPEVAYAVISPPQAEFSIDEVTEDFVRWISDLVVSQDNVEMLSLNKRVLIHFAGVDPEYQSIFIERIRRLLTHQSPRVTVVLAPGSWVGVTSIEPDEFNPLLYDYREANPPPPDQNRVEYPDRILHVHCETLITTPRAH